MDWKGLPVLVTGGASFIGSHLVDALVAKSAKVTIIDDLSSGRLENLRSHIDAGQVRFIEADLRRQDAAEAAARLEEACRVNPDDYQAPTFVAQAYLSLHRRAHASAAFRKTVERIKKHIAYNSDDARALYLGAASLIELGEMEQAQEWVNRALEIDPEDALVLYNVACTYAQLGEYDNAIDCLEKAIDSGMGQKEWIENDPYFDPLRNNERFKTLLGRLDPVSLDSSSGSD